MTSASARPIRAVSFKGRLRCVPKSGSVLKRNDSTQHWRCHTRSAGVYIYRKLTWRIMSTYSATGHPADNTFTYPAPLDSTEHSRPVRSTITLLVGGMVGRLLSAPASSSRYRIKPKQEHLHQCLALHIPVPNHNAAKYRLIHRMKHFVHM